VSFATLFADITSDDQTTGTWAEVAFETRTRPTLILTNPTDFTETLSDVGFLLSDTHIPLDSLNFGGEPPPGVPGSMFDLLAKLDGTNCSVDITLPAPIPELPVWFMLCGGLAGLIGFREFRRKANPRSDAAIRRKAALHRVMSGEDLLGRVL
jgi:hypothetical protein